MKLSDIWFTKHCLSMAWLKKLMTIMDSMNDGGTHIHKLINFKKTSYVCIASILVMFSPFQNCITLMVLTMCYCFIIASIL